MLLAFGIEPGVIEEFLRPDAETRDQLESTPTVTHASVKNDLGCGRMGVEPTIGIRAQMGPSLSMGGAPAAIPQHLRVFRR